MNYVNNTDMLNELILFRESYDKWEDTKIGDKPLPSKIISDMLIQIATNYSSKSNFSNYTWKRDMISEAVFTCIRYLHKFDPNKYNNPFAYFTKVVHNSFIMYIKKQKKHAEIKDELYENFQEKCQQDDYGFTKSISYEDYKPLEISDVEFVCSDCGHIWLDSLKKKKKSCPKCGLKSIEKVKYIDVMCNNCGYEWKESDKNVECCPECHSDMLYKPIKVKKYK